MNYNALRIRELYFEGKRQAVEGGDAELYVGLYYYLNCLSSRHSVIEGLFSSYDAEWGILYDKYVKSGNYRFDAQSMYDLLVETMSEIENDQNQLSVKLLVSSKGNFLNTVKRSVIGQPIYAGIGVGLCTITNKSNVAVIH